MKYFIVAIVFLTANANAQQTDVDVRAAISAQNEKYEQGFLERDIEKIVSVHTEDVIVYAPNRPVYRGHMGVRQMVGEDFAATDTYTLDLITKELEVYGDTAIDTGEYIANLTLKDGATIIDMGNYIVIWKRQADGTWLYSKDIFNSRDPLPF